jgi:serine-type D-Ala-D-Ala carboxypeptidase/endopeptidase (penicillin-binding protein 4)
VAARRVKLVGAAVIVAVAVGIGAAAGVVRHEDAASARARNSAASSSPATSAEPSALLSPSPAPTPAPSASLQPVLQPVGTAEGSDPAKVAAKLTALGGVQGGRISAAVISADSGKLLYQNGGATGLIPASTTKLLTMTAALKLMGPAHHFRTSVVAEPASSSGASARHPRSITLVGGGDPYLADRRKDAVDPGQASLEALAASTAKKLKADHATSVRLGYDASLFGGPAWNPTWPANYTTVVTRTTALWANEGRLYGSEGPRQPDPARSAASAFAIQLKKRGIKVSSIATAKAPAGAEEIAGVNSLSLERIIERLLMASDNDAAEVIARQVAIANHEPGTITNAVNSIKETLTALGAWQPGTRIYDGSGLSRSGRVPAETLVKVLRLSVAGDQPHLGPVITGLPVAGVEGSLFYRFDESGATVGRGLVHAKTGTLRKAHALAGYAYTRDGELLVFAFVVNNAKNDYKAVAWLDRAAASVATCGCRR